MVSKNINKRFFLPKISYVYWVLSALFLFSSCRQEQKPEEKEAKTALAASEAITSCSTSPPNRFAVAQTAEKTAIPASNTGTSGMVLIPAGTFSMGADTKEARADEFPKHKVSVESFWMDETEVTNAQFREFTEATGYVTTAEKEPDWNELKKQLPPGTPKPPDSILVASSLVFVSPKRIFYLYFLKPCLLSSLVTTFCKTLQE